MKANHQIKDQNRRINKSKTLIKALSMIKRQLEEVRRGINQHYKTDQ